MHGGEKFAEAVLIDDEAIAAIEELAPLAPMHNPVNLTGIRLVLHLGNGASATAISGGRSADTSMGLTPLEGLVMGTRSGDVDPALAGYLSRVAGLDGEQVEHALTREGGLLALTGSNDMREARARDDDEARLALEIYVRRIRKYVGAYYALLERVDAIVFTGGIGEHDAATRAGSLAGLGRLGITVDAALNETASTGERAVSPPGAEVPVLAIPTDEEWEIAGQTLEDRPDRDGAGAASRLARRDVHSTCHVPIVVGR